MGNLNATGKHYQATQLLISKSFGYLPPKQMADDFPLLLGPSNAEHLYIREEKGEVVAHAGAFLTNIKSDGLILPVGAVGGVCTKEEFRGQGHAREMVQMAENDLRDRGAILSFLWTGQHDYYRADGYELVGRQWSIQIDPSSLPKQPMNTFTIKTGLNNFAWDSAYLLYCRHSLGVSRTKQDFKTLLSIPGAEVWWAEKSGRLVAYVVMNKGIDLLDHIHEWAGQSDALLYILSEMSAHYQRPLHLLSPHFTESESPFLYSLDQSGLPLRLGYMGMIKILNLVRLQEFIEMHIVEKGFKSGSFKILKYPEGSIDTEAEVEWLGYKYRASKSAILQLLFGPDIPENFSPVLPDTVLRDLNFVFPMRLWWWGLDSV